MGFDEKNELEDFDFSKEIEMPEEMDTGAIAENIQTITDSSVGMEEMELYDDNSTKVMDAIPHSNGVISDLQLLPEDEPEDIGMTTLMPEAQELVLPEEPVIPAESEYLLADEAPDVVQEDISLSGRAEEELGDLSYHDEDVEIERPCRERSAEHRTVEHRGAAHRSAEHRDGEHRRPEHRNGERRSAEHRSPEHRNGEHRNGEHRRPEQRSAEHRRPAGAPEHKAKNAQHSTSRKPSSQHASSSQGYKGPRIQKEEKRKFGLFDMILIGGGVVVLVFLAIFLTVFLKKRSYNHQVENVAEVGEKLASLSGIGSTGIDGIVAHRTTATIDSITDDEEDGPSIDISVNFSSMEKDLKIKFSDKVTDELITGVLFKVEAKSPDNKELTWTDDDKDGIIYEENLKPGIYKVKIANVDKYKFPDTETDVTVKEKISYTAINIVNEIKKEKDINVAMEDGRVNEIDTGVQLQDTVAWVESSQKSIYQEVAKDTINAPIKQASLTQTSRNAEGTSENNSEEPKSETTSEQTSETTSEQTSEPSSEKASEQTSEKASEEPASEVLKPITAATLDKTSASLIVGEKLQLNLNRTPSDAPIKTITWQSSNTDVATVESGLVTAKAKGDATITCIVRGKDNTSDYMPTCTVTVTDGYVTSLKLNKTNEIMAVKATLQLTPTIEVSAASVSKEVVWTSSNNGYATVDSTGKVTAVAETPSGTKVTITCTSKVNGKDGKPLVATCTLTVSNAMNDNTTQLKDKSGNQVYVKDGENFREAKSADYYKYSNFYIKKNVYTGWQTVNGKTQYYKADGNFVTGEQVIGGVKYNFANDGSLSMGGGSMGIDVSSWNGNINWTAVKNSGVSFVIIRCGYRGYTQGGLIEDSKFHTYASGAEAAGLKVGVYFFSQATNEREAVEEASMAISMAKNHKISYPIFIDSEYGAANHNGRADRLDKATRTACIKAFCETVRSAGYTPGVYASKSWYYNNLDAGQLNNYKIWLAHYCAQTDYKGKYELWQSSNTGRINGISGNVDINTSYLGY